MFMFLEPQAEEEEWQLSSDIFTKFVLHF